ncbi:MAG: hypothetical protein KGD73_06755 [Candidatus Lokiarchaeota archaeon]|nr:hypothetical protein [Candidatus Lokiarchaeota archaeon]
MDFKIWNSSRSEKVIEVFLYPNSTHLGKKIEVSATISDGIKLMKEKGLVEVVDWIGGNVSEVEPMRDVFISYLGVNHSVFGINESTVWTGFANAPMTLVVEHYLFISENWELELARHVMIPPYDWIQVYARQRSELSPIWAGKINSWSSGNWTIVELKPPETIYR